ncbi:polysaccharide biosynthesis tyrosine autokinase [Arthrobacter gyeryongensis]|uniref:Polysaccharide biosynthesis tyrosine autokinase n=1 Tax=Arthrobacter gyeryongensis TaxID=1650592 RepID=A0ABP9SBC1_9MICC
MDLRDYLRILRRNWILVLAAMLGGLLLGGAVTILTTPTYTADTELFVAIQSSGSVQELQQGNTFTQSRVQSYVKTVESPVVLQPVIDSLGLNLSADQLAGQVSAKSDPNTVIISISASDHSPAQAAALAQGVATSLIKAVDTLEKPRSGGSSPVNLSIIKPAEAPTTPSAPNTRLTLLIGLIAGLAAGVGMTILRATMDSRIRGEAELRHITDAPLLGGIAFDQDAVRKPLLTQTGPQSPRAESFRQLRTNLQFANVSGHAKTVLVTSSLPGEGKSTTATNLAIALAQAGQSVCLIDADLRRPMIDEYLGLERGAGLTTALVGSADVTDLLQPWGDDNLYVLTSGQIPPNPSELLGSSEMKHLILRLEEAFDTIVVDAPPLLPVTDAAVLSQHVGGVVLVVGSQKLRSQDLAKSLAALKMVDSSVLGIILNRLPAKGPDAYAYTYYSSDEPHSKLLSGSKRRSVEQTHSAQAPPSEVSFDTMHPSQLEAEQRPASTFPSSRIYRS